MPRGRTLYMRFQVFETTVAVADQTPLGTALSPISSPDRDTSHVCSSRFPGPLQVRRVRGKVSVSGLAVAVVGGGQARLFLRRDMYPGTVLP